MSTILIKNATIVDGTKADRYEADLLVKDGKIDTIEKDIQADADTVIDATGKIVSPGFVDCHTHIDPDMIMPNCSLADTPRADNFVRQGITTALGGHCGYSVIDLDGFLNKLDKGTAINGALLIGHGALRQHVVGGSEDRDLTEAELEQMKELVREAMKAGAYGLSTGLGYTPGSVAKPEEIVELVKVVKEYDGVYTSHIRNQDMFVEEAWDEFIEVGRKTGVQLHLSHSQCIGHMNFGKSVNLMKKLMDARAKGLVMTTDAFPYEGAGILFTQVLFPKWALDGGTGLLNEALLARLNDEEQVEKMLPEIKELIEIRGTPEGLLIAASIVYPEKTPEISGLYLSDMMKKYNTTAERAAVELIKEYGEVVGTAFQCCYEDKLEFYKNDYCTVASDSIPEENIRAMGIPCQPREYGNFPRFFDVYVKENKEFTIEEAIYKMTKLPADSFKLNDRGVLKPGYVADITIFDFDEFTDLATYENPHTFPSGLEHVIVNGELVVHNGEQLDALPGGSLRKGKN